LNLFDINSLCVSGRAGKIGFHLFNLHISTTRTLILSLPVSVIAVLARELPLPFGIHTIILIVSSALLAVVITQINWQHCFMSITAGTLIVGVLEGVLLPIFLKITTTEEELHNF